MADDDLEVLYEPQRGSPRALAASWIGAALFMSFVAWLMYRLLRSPLSMGIAAAVTAVVLLAQSRYAPGGVRATRRVTADRRARTVTWTWRGGELCLPWSEIESMQAERVTGGDGVDLAAVVLHRAGGEVLRFGVRTDDAAKGITDALAALRADEPPA